MTRSRTAALAAALAALVRGTAAAAAGSAAARSAVTARSLADDDACAAPSANAASPVPPRCAAALLQHGAAAPRRRGVAASTAGAGTGAHSGGAAATARAMATQVPETMKAVDGAYAIETIAVPATMIPGTLLVRIAASSVNPVDWKMANIDRMMGRSASRSLYIPVDYAGVVAEVGEGCSFAVGDEVWGMFMGTWSEYLVAQCIDVGQKPSTATFAEAGALPLVALTSLECFNIAGAPWSSAPTVLILGGSGGVGHVAIQLAKDLGAGRVVTTTSAANADFVRGLGADEVIDYTTTDWATTLGPDSVDIVLDAVGEPNTATKAFGCIRAGGHYVTITEPVPAAERAAGAQAGVSTAFVLLGQSTMLTSRLDVLRGFVDSGKLKVTIDSTFPLSDIKDAVAYEMAGHVDGKVSISFRPDA